MREDPTRPGLLYAGTETGLYVSFDDGASWQPFQRNLPVVPITDLAVKNDDLVVATQGRAFWILDDLTPLRLEATRFRRRGVSFSRRGRRPFGGRTVRRGGRGRAAGVGKNLPDGVLIYYWLKEKPKEKEKVTVEILGRRKVLRSFTSEKKEKEGDLRSRPAAAEVDEGQGQAARAQGGLNRLRLGHEDLQADRSCRRPLQRGDQGPAESRAGTTRCA